MNYETKNFHIRAQRPLDVVVENVDYQLKVTLHLRKNACGSFLTWLLGNRGGVFNVGL